MKKIILALFLIALCSFAFAAPLTPIDAPMQTDSQGMLHMYQIHFVKAGHGGKMFTEYEPVANKTFWLVGQDYKIITKITTDNYGVKTIGVNKSLLGATDSSNTQSSGKVTTYWKLIKGYPSYINTSSQKSIAPIDSPAKDSKDIQRNYKN